MATKKTPNPIPEKTMDLFEQLVKTIPEINWKGKTMPYTSVNGHMFSFLDKTGAFSLRLPKEEREAFLEKYKTSLSVQYGTVMKEYVLVPDQLLGKLKELSPYFELSYAYTKSLKPKPTKRKKL